MHLLSKEWGAVQSYQPLLLSLFFKYLRNHLTSTVYFYILYLFTMTYSSRYYHRFLIFYLFARIVRSLISFVAPRAGRAWIETRQSTQRAFSVSPVIFTERPSRS